MSYFLNHFSIIAVSAENSFHIKKYKPKITLFFGTLGILALFVNTATIDTGYMNTHLHVLCAGCFFLFTIIACIYNTLIYWVIYLHIKSINFVSLIIKTILVLGMIIQIYLNEEGFLSYDEFTNSDLAHYIEFTLAFTILGYFLIMGYDLKGFKMIYRKHN